ncbi:MAG: hypothetical protein Ta2E_00400 [Mycoplasmoidaceae bacterium]|nr:MAG: hypothetical protein Ta2E_00400 [Mycoplasmoidaceae bacterium]
MTNYLENKLKKLNGSYNCIDAIPAEINIIRIIDYIKFNNLKAYDENDDEVNFYVDQCVSRENQKRKKWARRMISFLLWNRRARSQLLSNTQFQSSERNEQKHIHKAWTIYGSLFYLLFEILWRQRWYNWIFKRYY